MVARGRGLVANITSSVAWMDPPAPAGEGGWGLGYAMSKGALHRVAGLVQLELAGSGVALVNVDPGFIATERMAQDMAEFGFDVSAGAPPDVIGAVVRGSPVTATLTEWAGGVVPGQRLCHEEGLLPGWAGPVPNPV